MILPDHIINKIADPAERKKHGPTWSEGIARGNHRSELKLHAQFSGFLKRHEDKIALVHHTNPAKRTHATVGEPDYCIHLRNGKTIFLEMKVGKNTLTPEQNAIRIRLESAGYPFLVTGNLEEAIRFVLEFINP